MAISVQPIEFTVAAIKKKADGAKSIALVSADKKTDRIINDVAKALVNCMQADGENVTVGKNDSGIAIFPVANALYDYECAKVAGECDKTVIVVKYGHTAHKALQSLKSVLQLCGADVIGAIAKR